MSQRPQTVPVEAITFLFDRPTEPIFNRKGSNGNVQFNIPPSYYIDKYKPALNDITQKFGEAEVTYHIKELTNIPDLSLPESIGLKENFSVFNPYHLSCAVRLIEILLDAKSVEDFVSLSAYCKDRVNPFLYVYALSVALLHRQDTRNVPIPSHLHSFPELYMDRSVFSTAREEENIVPEGSRRAIEIPMDYTASDLDLEHRVAYFREDVGINLHHWHWHLVYPLEGRREIVGKDRRGELFYYMHQQIVARYNMERLCNHLPRVRRLVDLREPIEEGYYPKLDSAVASRGWPSRHPRTRLTNVNREADRLQVDIQDLERWRDRIFEAIHNGRYLVQNKNETQVFRVEDGIDVLGNMVESNALSANRTEYGNLHNHGHNLISYIHDPENQFLEYFGVMGDSSTAMRDPAFYRWHAFINYMFEQYKHTLPPYEEKQLTFENVRVTKIQLKTNGLPTENEISTFWQQADIDLSRGLDFAESKGSVYARVTHLQHAPFQYSITVENKGAARAGTVRIFYAPKHDEKGSVYLFKDQKGLFVELDRFTYNLRNGVNVITRSSLQSSVTIPYEQTFRNLSNKPTGGEAEAAYNFCGCGWPQHMLVAKGHSIGFVCQLFVMISNYQNDQVQGASSTYGKCDDASSYCGVRDSKYPDKQAMGYPFDRLPRTNVLRLKEFLTPNMNVQDITVRFTERIVAPIQRTPATTVTNPGTATRTRT